ASKDVKKYFLFSSVIAEDTIESIAMFCPLDLPKSLVPGFNSELLDSNHSISIGVSSFCRLLVLMELLSQVVSLFIMGFSMPFIFRASSISSEVIYVMLISKMFFWDKVY